MMSSSEVVDLRNAGEDMNSELRIETHKLDTIESDGINLQCINSSDFMVGKQTNFNGPVTIINCADGGESEHFRGQPGKEEVIIKEKIMTPTVAATMENFAKKKAQEKSERTRSFKYIRKGACTKKFLGIPVYVWATMLFVSFAGFITVITGLYLVDAKELEPSFITIDGKKFRFVTRQEWGAVKVRSIPRLTLPVPYVVVSHTATQPCDSIPKCSESVRNMQIHNINTRNFPDIKYNFLVASDGTIYEGRGWLLRSEAPGRANNRNIDIALIGNFGTYPPTENQVQTLKALVKHAAAVNYTRQDYFLIAARLTVASESPGKCVVEIIKNWPHFTAKWPDNVASL